MSTSELLTNNIPCDASYSRQSATTIDAREHRPDDRCLATTPTYWTETDLYGVDEGCEGSAGSTGLIRALVVDAMQPIELLWMLMLLDWSATPKEVQVSSPDHFVKSL